MDRQFIYIAKFIIVVISVDRFQQSFYLCDAKLLQDTCVHQMDGRSNVECLQNDICSKQFNISYINRPPYNTFEVIENILRHCCGECVKYRITTFNNVVELTQSAINTSHFVLPFLSTSSAEQSHGFYYLPYIDAPNTLYITKNNDNSLLSLLKLYPIVIICLLFSAVSGFIAWICETWANKEEFQRPFLIGWFDGIWWSFITMTTVGYGDKTPRSTWTRLFSIVWVLIGMISFAIFTGQITGQIVKSNSPPPADMKDSVVGILPGRDYERYVISINEGTIHEIKNASWNIATDIIQLIRDLEEKKVDGLLLDQWEFLWITSMLKNMAVVINDDSVKKKIDFFLKDTTRVEIPRSRRLAYGILVKYEEDYNYFKYFVNDDRQKVVIATTSLWQTFKSHSSNRDGFYSSKQALLFSPYSDYFQYSMIVMGVMIVSILLFGVLYEYRINTFKRHKRNKTENNELV